MLYSDIFYNSLTHKNFPTGYLTFAKHTDLRSNVQFFTEFQGDGRLLHITNITKYKMCHFESHALNIYTINQISNNWVNYFNCITKIDDQKSQKNSANEATRNLQKSVIYYGIQLINFRFELERRACVVTIIAQIIMFRDHYFLR
jgi:hypothetical protein